MDIPTYYEIRVKGHLDDSWADSFDGLTITNLKNGEALLSGSIQDQAALQGVLNRISNLGLSLISVNSAFTNDTNTKEQKMNTTISRPDLIRRRVLRIYGSFFKRIQNMFGWSILILGVVSLAGTVYQAIAAAQDRHAYPAPGQMVSVGDRRLHLFVTGEENGYPTVILEAGVASFSSNWYWVQEELSQITRVVSYDRAGLGWSDPAPEPFDAYQSAHDLHTALENAGIPGPYVVVAHSYGGLVMQAFTNLYPNEVVGMVLVDTSHVDQWARMPSSRGGSVVAAGNRFFGFLARVGIIRLFNIAPKISGSVGLPEQQAAEMNANLSTVQPWSTSGDVIAIWNTRTRSQLSQAQYPYNIPLIVLSATERPDYGKGEMDSQQDDLATLSSNSRHLKVDGATHESLIAEQKYAHVVTDAIGVVLEISQTGEMLSSVDFPKVEHP